MTAQNSPTPRPVNVAARSLALPAFRKRVIPDARRKAARTACRNRTKEA